MKNIPSRIRPVSSEKKQQPTTMSLAFEDCLKKKADAEKKQAVKNAQKVPPEVPPSHPKDFQLPSVNKVGSHHAQPKSATRGVYVPPRTQDGNTLKKSQPQSERQSCNARPSGSRYREKLELTPVAPQTLTLTGCPLSIQNHTRSSRRRTKQSPLRFPDAQIVSKSPEYADEADIVIGFDFGTSSSKVVIQDVNRRKAYAIPFAELACSGNTYLMPTRIYVDTDGHLSLSKGLYEHTDLKMQLIEPAEQPVFQGPDLDVSARELAAAYIALVLQYAREWFLAHTRIIYAKTRIHWHINLGVPSRNYDDTLKRERFRVVVMAAWPISLLNNINIVKVKSIIQEAGERLATPNSDSDTGFLWLHPDFVNTHPEVITEVAGYVFSPLRNSGLHLLVDIGATTLDLATFRIYQEDGENQYPLLETEVKQLGTLALHNRRVQTVKQNLESVLRKKNTVDPLEPLPEPDFYEVTSTLEAIRESDNRFYDECSKLIGEVIRKTFLNRDPNSSHWKKGLPVFICGGGSHIDGYRDMVDARAKTIAQRTDIQMFDIKEIPKPDAHVFEAPELSASAYNRLAVAYGLSFDAERIGKVIPTGEVSDITTKAVCTNIEDRFIDKEQC